MLRTVEVVTQCIQAAKKALLIKSNREHKKNARIIHDGVSWAALYWDEKEKITHAKPTPSIICNAFGQREASLNSSHVRLVLKPASAGLSQPVCHPACPVFPASLSYSAFLSMFTGESLLHQQHHHGQCSFSRAGKWQDPQSCSARAISSTGSFLGYCVRLLQSPVQLFFFCFNPKLKLKLQRRRSRGVSSCRHCISWNRSFNFVVSRGWRHLYSNPYLGSNALWYWI